MVKSLHLICGVYDVSELRHTDTVNANNILQIADDNCKKLSPLFFNFGLWTTDAVRIHIYAAQFDCIKLLEHAQRLHATLERNACTSRYVLMMGLDHFDIVETLTEADHQINETIVNELQHIH